MRINGVVVKPFTIRPGICYLSEWWPSLCGEKAVYLWTSVNDVEFEVCERHCAIWRKYSQDACRSIRTL